MSASNRTQPSSPFAAWLEVFLAKPSVPTQAGTSPRLLHIGRAPRPLRPLIVEERWQKRYPFTVAGRASTAALREASTEARILQLTPWLASPDIRLTLSRAAVDYLLTTIPLAPGDLHLTLAEARRLDFPTPTEIGPVAPRVAYLLYALSSLGAPLRRFRPAQARIIDQLVRSIRHRLPDATPADLLALHVMMRQLLARRAEVWVRTALQLCLPFSPLTFLLNDSDISTDLLADITPYSWVGMENALWTFGLDGLQVRCGQALIAGLMPGLDWHAADEPTRHARFRRGAELLRRLANVMADPALDSIRAMRLAAWVLRTYRVLGQTLDIYQRVMLPPAIDPKGPPLTPSFRMLRQFLPENAQIMHDNYGGLVAPVPAVLTLLVEACRMTGSTVLVPSGLPKTPRFQPFPRPGSSEAKQDALAAAQRLLDAWYALDSRFVLLLRDLYVYVNELPQPETTSLLDESADGGTDSGDLAETR